jgi:hypothetical protein
VKIIIDKREEEYNETDEEYPAVLVPSHCSDKNYSDIKHARYYRHDIKRHNEVRECVNRRNAYGQGEQA